MMKKAAMALACSVVLLVTLGCNRHFGGDADIRKGQSLYDQRMFVEAIVHFKRGLAKMRAPGSRSEVLTSIGNCYKELNAFEDALKYHQQAIDADPGNHAAYVNKGIVHRLMGDYDLAARAYAKALELAPDFAELHASMGALAVFQDDIPLAIKHLERATALDDTLAVAHSNLAVAYASAQRFKEADAELKKAVLRGYHQPEAVKARVERLRMISKDKP